jgi:hypothetical protein
MPVVPATEEVEAGGAAGLSITARSCFKNKIK